MEEAWKVPLSFMFEVSFSGPRSINAEAFAEVSGLNTTIDLESVVEGGENTFVHQLPKPVKNGPLKLKRQLEARGDGLRDWCKDVLEGGFARKIDKMDLAIKALDREAKVLAEWNVKGAFPIKWEISSFDASKSELLIESLELAYETVKRG